MSRKSNIINVIIADDHPLFRKGLRDVIEAEDHLAVIAEAGDGESALYEITRHNPDVAILDIEMPRLNGLDLTERIINERMNVGIIILTMYDEESLFNRAIDLGVTGYVLKDSAAEDIVQGIELVSEGGYFISPTLSSRVMKHTSVKTAQDEKLGLLLLTPAERRILHLIAQDLTSNDIAERLNISVRTVEHHRSNIIGKLNLSGQYALVRFALQHKDEL